MQSETNNESVFKTREEINDYLKTRVESFSLGLSIRTSNTLASAGIRTVGGIIRNISSLSNIKGLGIKGIQEIKEKIKDVQGAKESLKNIFPSFDREIRESGTQNNSGDIIEVFAKHFNLSREAIIEHNRKKEVVAVRDLIAYLLREYADMSFPSIGRLLGGRDHTTIIHAFRKLQNEVTLGANFESKYSDLITELKSIKERKEYVEQNVIPEIVESVRSGVKTKGHRFKFKEISFRDMRILELYREGLTLRNISKIVNISGERVRQIAEKTIRQLAINDSISGGIVIDADTLVEEEKKHRQTIQKGEEKIVKPKKEKRWSRYYIACKSCGTTEIPHVKNGLCEKCAGHFKGDRRENIISSHNNACDSCGILRYEAVKNYGRDFYITKDKRVLCRKCFSKEGGKKLGSYKNYNWSRYYPSCISCSTTSIPHFGKGLCEKCADKMTKERRESIITKSNGCHYCGISRVDARKKYGKDLYVTKDNTVSCLKCFLDRRFKR